jgi:uncharacterized Zn-binding protein involved in type VI secretion
VRVVTQAAKFFDVVIGVDVHLVMVPTPAGPVPTPLPHPFTGYVWDLAGACMSKLTGGGSVFVNGIRAANTGTAVKALVKHFPTPPGVAFSPSDVPGNEGSIVMGSKTVSFCGSSAARMGSMVTPSICAAVTAPASRSSATTTTTKAASQSRPTRRATRAATPTRAAS